MTDEIVLSELDWFLGGAQFFALLAYPDDIDSNRRAAFQQAIVRWTLEWRISADDKWARSHQVMIPAYFSGSNDEQDRLMKHGTKRLNDRLVAAHFFALPHFRELDTGVRQRPEGLVPTINNMAILAAAHRGWSEASFTNAKSNIWGPSRTVIHAAAAYQAWDSVIWQKWGRNPAVDRKLAFLLIPDFVEEVVWIAEYFRSQMHQVKQFQKFHNRVRQIQTIWSPNTGIFQQLPKRPA